MEGIRRARLRIRLAIPASSAKERSRLFWCFRLGCLVVAVQTAFPIQTGNGTATRHRGVVVLAHAYHPVRVTQARSAARCCSSLPRGPVASFELGFTSARGPLWHPIVNVYVWG